MLGFFDQALPERECCGVAGLQCNDALARAIRKGGIIVKMFLCSLVERVEVADGVTCFGIPFHLDEMFDEHAKLRAPVAHMILPNDAMALKGKHARDGIADDRRAQMADVHFLGDVGT